MRALCQRLTWHLTRDRLAHSKPNLFLRLLSTKIRKFLKHPAQMTIVILVRHHVMVNLKCLTTARQPRTVICLYPCCVVQHDSDHLLTFMGIGRFHRKHLIFCLYFICWRDCDEFALQEPRVLVDGATLISADWIEYVLPFFFCTSQPYKLHSTVK